MEWVEITAKSVDDAKELALDQLGVDEHDAEFEVLEEPKPGLFGRLRGEARVRARVRPVQARPKAERRRARPRKGEGGRRGGTPTPEGTAPPPSDEPIADVAGGDDDDPEAAPAEELAAPHEAATADPADAGPSRRRGRRGGRSRSSRGTDTDRSPTDDAEEPTMTDDQLDLDTQAEIVREFLDGLVDAFDLDAELSVVRIDDDTAEVRLDGDDLGLLVGPRGATLQAITELSRTVVQRASTGPVSGRVRVDVAGYRERRREALERFTRGIAEQVLESGRAQVLEPMAPPDRKVVHDVVNTIDGVRTESEGEEPNRRVVIVPDA